MRQQRQRVTLVALAIAALVGGAAWLTLGQGSGCAPSNPPSAGGDWSIAQAPEGHGRALKRAVNPREVAAPGAEDHARRESDAEPPQEEANPRDEDVPYASREEALAALEAYEPGSREWLEAWVASLDGPGRYVLPDGSIITSTREGWARDDNGEVFAYLHYDPNRDPQYWLDFTWGDPAPGDLEAPPTTEQLLDEFGMWMQREDGMYAIGFLSGDDRFIEFRTGGTWRLRAFEDVPAGRNLPRLGSNRVLHRMGGPIDYGVVDGGYAIPGFNVEENPGGGPGAMFIHFEDYPRIAIRNVRPSGFSSASPDFSRRLGDDVERVLIRRPTE